MPGHWRGLHNRQFVLIVFENLKKKYFVEVNKTVGSFNNWNTIQLSHKSTPHDKFDEIHELVLDGIGDNMDSLVQYGKYGTINSTDTATKLFM